MVRQLSVWCHCLSPTLSVCVCLIIQSDCCPHRVTPPTPPSIIVSCMIDSSINLLLTVCLSLSVCCFYLCLLWFLQSEGSCISIPTLQTRLTPPSYTHSVHSRTHTQCTHRQRTSHIEHEDPAGLFQSCSQMFHKVLEHRLAHTLQNQLLLVLTDSNRPLLISLGASWWHVSYWFNWSLLLWTGFYSFQNVSTHLHLVHHVSIGSSWL